MTTPTASKHPGSVASTRRSARYRYAGGWLLLVLSFLARFEPVAAHGDGQHPEDLLATATFEQRLNAQVPLDLRFRDETGNTVQLGSYLGTKPVILALVYYKCPNLCTTFLEDLVEDLRTLPFDVRNQFDVVTVSIDPRETPAISQATKARLLSHYGRVGVDAGWHALTGEQAAIERLADVVGFRYAYDATLQQYAHPSGLIVLTPQGKISRYLYGLVYTPTDLRLALVEASANKIGSLTDQILLRCYRFDFRMGRYTLAIMNMIRLTGLLTVLALTSFSIIMFRRDRRQRLADQTARI